jgi:hypothetical protein
MKSIYYPKANSQDPHVSGWRAGDDLREHPLSGEYCEFGAIISPEFNGVRHDLDQIEKKFDLGSEKVDLDEADPIMWGTHTLGDIVLRHFSIRPLVTSVPLEEITVRLFYESRFSFACGNNYAAMFCLRGFIEGSIDFIYSRLIYNGIRKPLERTSGEAVTLTDKINFVTKGRDSNNACLYRSKQILNEIVHGGDVGTDEFASETIKSVRSSIEALLDYYAKDIGCSVDCSEH